MRLIFLVVAALLAAPAALAQKYAVLSLIGDQLLVVEREMGTGSRLDRNARTFLPIPGRALDREVLFAVEDELKRLDRNASVVLMGANDAALYAEQKRLLDQDAELKSMLPVVANALKGSDATHLVLAVKYRGDARLRVEDGYIGAGKLEGVGFYLDPSTRLIQRETGERSEGFVAPFAYFRLALVDLRAASILSDVPIQASATVGRQDAVTPWKALSEDDKARYLRTLIRSEVRRVMPQLLRR